MGSMAVGLRVVRLLVRVKFLWLRVGGACSFKVCFEDSVGQVGYCSSGAIYGLEYWVKSGTEPVGCQIMV